MIIKPVITENHATNSYIDLIQNSLLLIVMKNHILISALFSKAQLLQILFLIFQRKIYFRLC